MLCMYAILIFPFCQHTFWFCIHEHTYTFPVHKFEIRRSNIHVWQISIKDIFFFTHRFIWKKHPLCTFIGVRDIAHDINLTIFKLIEAVGPVTFHVLKFPSGIACQSLQEFIPISSSDTVFIDIIKGIFKGSDTDDLWLFFIIILFSGPAVYW